MTIKKISWFIFVFFVLSGTSVQGARKISFVTASKKVKAYAQVLSRDEVAGLFGSEYGATASVLSKWYNNHTALLSTLHNHYIILKVSIANTSSETIYVRKNKYLPALKKYPIQHTAKKVLTILQPASTEAQKFAQLLFVFTVLLDLTLPWVIKAAFKEGAERNKFFLNERIINHTHHSTLAPPYLSSVGQGLLGIYALLNAVSFTQIISSFRLASKLNNLKETLGKTTTLLYDTATQEHREITTPHFYEIPPGNTFNQLLFIKVENADQQRELHEKELTLDYYTLQNHLVD